MSIDKILNRRGLKKDLPFLDAGEFGFCEDTNQLLIGTPNGNLDITSAESILTLGGKSVEYALNTHNHDGTNGASISFNDLAGLPTLSFRNYIINGNFDIWQRGTSFNFTSNTGAIPNYTADRWYTFLDGTTGAYAVSRIEIPPGQLPGASESAAYGLRAEITASGNSTIFHIGQFIENVRTLAGKKTATSIYLRANTTKTITIFFVQRLTNTEASIVFTKDITATPSWAKYDILMQLPSVAGKTIETRNFLQFVIESKSPQAGDFIEIAQVQLEEGEVATPFEQRPIQVEEMLCLRYFEQMIIQRFTTAPLGAGYNVSTFPYKVIKRAYPTVILRSAQRYTTADGLNPVDLLSSDVYVSGGRQSLIIGLNYKNPINYGVHFITDIDAEIY